MTLGLGIAGANGADSKVRQLGFAHGRAKKRNNAIVAILSGALPGIVLSYYMHPGSARWGIGGIIGLL
jgi:hypothetical protein